MNNPDLFVETSVDAAPISVPAAVIAEDILKLASIAQQTGQELDEIVLSAKFNQDGRLVLTNNGGITLRFSHPGRQTASVPSMRASAVREVDRYALLRDLLSAAKWQDANQETWNLLCQSLNKPLGTYLSSSEVGQIPCDVLQSIDRLWQENSAGKFGFSIQKQLSKQ